MRGDADTDSRRGEGSEAFPFVSIGTIWAVNFASTFANWSVMPFVPFMVYDLGLVDDYREPGLYAGLIIAANRIGTMATAYPCGRWSDKHGRKPPLQVGLLGLAITTLAFGFSSSLEMAVLVRFVGGLAAGGRDLTQVMVTEMCRSCPQHQARAMSGNAAMWGLAVVAGPALGGILARPAVNFPVLVSPDGLWGQFPYLPPCLFGSIMCLLCLVATCWLPETVGPNSAANSSNNPKKQEDEAEQSALLSEDGDGQTNFDCERVPQRQVDGRCRFCTNPVTQTVVTMRLVQAFYVVGDDNTFPLWTVAPRYAGGLDFSTSQTGLALAMMGGTVVLAQLCIYPVLSGWLGARQTYTVLCYTQVPLFCLQPLAAWFDDSWTVWAWLLFMCTKNMCIEMSIVGLAILQNNSVSSAHRGELSGFASTVSGLGQVLAPLCTTPLFAWSLTHGLSWPLDVWLVFLIYASCAGLNAWLGARLPLSIDIAK